MPQSPGHNERGSGGSDEVFGSGIGQYRYLEVTLEYEKELVSVRMHFPYGRYTRNAACANVVLIEVNDIQECAFRYRRKLREYVFYVHHRLPRCSRCDVKRILSGERVCQSLPLSAVRRLEYRPFLAEKTPAPQRIGASSDSISTHVGALRIVAIKRLFIADTQLAEIAVRGRLCDCRRRQIDPR